MAKLLVGTSGWVYEHWKEVFYPEEFLSIVPRTYRLVFEFRDESWLRG